MRCGDGTDALIAYLDEQTARPPRQLVFSTDARLDMTAFPLPAYDRIDLRNYFPGLGAVFLGLSPICASSATSPRSMAATRA